MITHDPIPGSDQPPQKKPLAVTMAQALFFLIAAFWIVSTVLGAVRIARGHVASTAVFWIVTVLMAANGLVLLGIGFRLNRRERPVYLFGLAVLAANILLSVTDQFGFWDALTMGVDIVLFILMLATRSLYTEKFTN